MIEGIIYALVFAFFFIMIFNALRALRLEKLFNQGKVFEIRFLFVISSAVLSYLICELINKLLSFGGLSL